MSRAATASPSATTASSRWPQTGDLSHAINYAEANDIKQWDGVEGDASAFAVSAKVTYHWTDITRTYVEAGYFEDEKTGER